MWAAAPSKTMLRHQAPTHVGGKKAGLGSLRIIRKAIARGSVALHDVPGLAVGLLLVLVGALLIPTDPSLEAVWDYFQEIVPFSDGLAGALTRSGNVAANGVLALLLLVLVPKRGARLAWASLLAGGAGALVTEVLKFVVGRGRPDAWAEVNVFVPFSHEQINHSFPSGHAANVAVMAIFMALALPRLRTPAALWAIGTGVARVTLDRHYFGDVMAGWGVGVAVSGLILWLFGLARSGDPIVPALLSRRSRLHALAAVALLLVAAPSSTTANAGGAVVLLGALLRIWALGHIKKNQEVCRTGPYALVRHPLYLSSTIVVLGVAIMANWYVLTLILLVGTLAVHFWLVRREETHLVQTFGSHYTTYAQQVPAFIPTPRSLSQAVFEGQFDWSVAAANRAVGVLPLVLLAYALMHAKQVVFEVLAHIQFPTTFGLVFW